jgi:hypothetical protein
MQALKNALFVVRKENGEIGAFAGSVPKKLGGCKVICRF